MIKPGKGFLCKPTYIRHSILILAFISPVFCAAQGTANANRPVFNHAALCAHNLKKTADFYSTVLLFQKVQHPFNDTLHVWFKIGEGQTLHIIQGNCRSTVQDISIHLCFSVPSLEVFMKHLDDLNVKYGNWQGEPKKIQLRPDGVSQIYFQDPDGNWIEVNNAR